ncbi:alcohol dehydrogenase-like protein [Xylogone sp. PMI_703]|nr:alcohol dehydrogenase-like protein [Xylogone sp. PMI_703]
MDLSFSAPPIQTAVITTADGTHAVSHDRPVPPCGPKSVLVRVRAVALNPTDHKTPARVRTAGLTAGCDFAGEVVAVGAHANEEPEACERSRRWACGDRVFGVVYGSNPGAPTWGAFAEYVDADPVMLCHVPDGWDWQTAAAVGGSVHGSVALCLFGRETVGLGLDMERLERLSGINGVGNEDSTLAKEDNPPLRNEDLTKVVLVYGGSTACGTMALQMLRLAGYIPITTCSPRNASLVRSYGAVATFDYNTPSCADDIRKYTRSALGLVLDCISTAQSAVLCYGALGRAGGRYVALERFPDSVAASRRAVKSSWVMGPVMFGRPLQLGDGYSQPADPTARAFARTWYPLAEELLNAHSLKSHPVRVFESGSEGGWPTRVVRGLDDLRDGSISGEKLVVTVSS